MTVCLPFSKIGIFDRKPENWVYFVWIYHVFYGSLQRDRCCAWSADM